MGHSFSAGGCNCKSPWGIGLRKIWRISAARFGLKSWFLFPMRWSLLPCPAVTVIFTCHLWLWTHCAHIYIFKLNILLCDVLVNFHQCDLDQCFIQFHVFHQFLQVCGFAFLLCLLYKLRLMNLHWWPSQILQFTLFFCLCDFSLMQNDEAVLVLWVEFFDCFYLLGCGVNLIQTSR